MWLIYLSIIFGLSTLNCWVHDGKVNGIELIAQSVLPVNYFYVQLVDVYGRK